MLIQRLDILKESQVIDEDAYSKTKKIIGKIIDEFLLDLDTEVGHMFVTHVSMAIMRIKNGEVSTTIENSVYEDIKESENFKSALKFADIVSEIIEYNVPKNEREYLVINACLLMEV